MSAAFLFHTSLASQWLHGLSSSWILRVADLAPCRKRRSKRIDSSDTHTEEVVKEASGNTWSAFVQGDWLLKPSHGLHFAPQTRTRPLTSLEVVLELISQTTTKEGLTVMAVKDSRIYPTGKKVSDDEFAALHLCIETFHGEWNYTIFPQSSLITAQLI